MSKGRRFDKVEQNMNHIQASLSRTSLITPEIHSDNVDHRDMNVDHRDLVKRLKRELEEKELLAKKYEMNITLQQQ